MVGFFVALYFLKKKIKLNFRAHFVRNFSHIGKMYTNNTIQYAAIYYMMMTLKYPLMLHNQ